MIRAVIATHDAGTPSFLSLLSVLLFVNFKNIFLALDVAASEFYSDEKYLLGGIGKDFSSSELVSYFSQLITKYPTIPNAKIIKPNFILMPFVPIFILISPSDQCKSK